MSRTVTVAVVVALLALAAGGLWAAGRVNEMVAHMNRTDDHLAGCCKTGL